MHILITVVLFFGAAAASPAAPEAAYCRIELAPSGSFVAIGALVSKGNAVLFHAYPDGRLMSVRKADVRKVSPITAQEAAAPPARKDLVSIGNLAMQGGSGAPAAGNSPRPSTASTGPSVIPVHDGLAITTSKPPPD